ncbi:MAG: rhomboid family intramembrane serine protease [Deltaproteobacteria bacterium]|nr:rhomboid family intramembrane serine protease [Deltaproteobacteria bacterium]MBW2152637.1 rhomboid family intramembrane serine protease [Deltaproteobacteria bacterium]
MIPVADENPSRSFPAVNILLISTNIAVFIYLNFFVPPGIELARHGFAFVPYEFFHLTDIGPKNLIPIPLSIFTAMFFHAGWLHLIGNMLYLWVFGDNIEDTLGHRRYLFFYICCGLVATLTHCFIYPNSTVPVIGASGAVAGVLGAYMFRYPGTRIRVLLMVFVYVRTIRLPAWMLLGFWIGLQIVNGFYAQTEAGVAWFAHIGGFFTGICLFVTMKKKRG